MMLLSDYKSEARRAEQSTNLTRFHSAPLFLLLYPEDGGNMILRNITTLLLSARPHIAKYINLHSHRP